MKKAYVKPVMESEAFVANEYVAACWTISCQGGCGTIKPKTPDDNYPSGVMERDDFLIYNGRIGNSDGCVTEDGLRDWVDDQDWIVWWAKEGAYQVLKWLLNYNGVNQFHSVSIDQGHVDATGKNHIPASI